MLWVARVPLQARRDTWASSCGRSVSVGPAGRRARDLHALPGQFGPTQQAAPSVGPSRGSTLSRQQSRGASVACGPIDCWMRIALSTILGENLEIGIQSLASLDATADPASLPHFAAPGPSPARQFHSLACFCSPAVVSSPSLPCPSFPLLLACVLSFIRSINLAKQSASSAALAIQTMNWQACAAVRWI